MNIDVIQQLEKAEVEASRIIREAEDHLQRLRDEIPETLEGYSKELMEIEKERQQEITERAKNEFSSFNEPIESQTKSEIHQLHNIAPEKRALALKTIVEKVVN